MRLFLDTNVLISGVLFGGVPGELLEMARAGEVTAIVSLHVLAEFVDVLTRPRIGLDEDVAVSLAEEITAFAEVVPVERSMTRWVSDPKDDPVVEAALVGKATHLVSGDARVLEVAPPGVSAITPARALGLLSRR